VATVVGYALNDSGIAVPAATLLVACPTLIVLLTREPVTATPREPTTTVPLEALR
jgi:hypothetical protein